MSLAMNAAPFEDSEKYELSNKAPRSIMKKPKNRTVKIRNAEKISSDNVNDVMGDIHDKDGDGELGDFTPLPPPASMGVEQTKSRENTRANEDDDEDNELTKYIIDTGENPSKDQPISSNNTDFDKYRAYIPDYQKIYGPGVEVDHLAPTSNTNTIMGSGLNSSVSSSIIDGKKMSGDPLIDKLNYVIHLLEEQKDDKTARVSEEVILYLFLGIFVIFIVDSFTRLGKYTR